MPEQRMFGRLLKALFEDSSNRDAPELKVLRHRLEVAWQNVREFSRRGRPTALPKNKELFRIPSALPVFAGRTAELIELQEFFSTEHPKFWIAIEGLPGTGKSSLAAQFVRLDHAPFEAVWWCHAETRETLLASLEELGFKLKVDRPSGMRAETFARFALQEASKRNWCLVYDNARLPIEIDDLLPADCTPLIITTQAAGWSGWADTLELDVMAAEDAVSLLKAGLDDRLFKGATELAETLGYLPLALAHASAACSQLGITFEDYARQLRIYLDELPASVRSSRITAESRPARTVAATLRFAIESVPEGEAAKQLLLLLSFCAPDPIPLYLVEDACAELGGLAADQRLLTLTTFSLARLQTFPDGSRAIVVHRLVQEVGRIMAEQSNTANSLADVVLICLRRFFPDANFRDPKVSSRCDQLLPHVMARWAAQYVASNAIDVWVALMTAAARHLRSHGYYHKAASIIGNVAQLADSALAKNDLIRVEAILEWAQLFEDEGDRATAKRIFRDIIPLLSDARGSNDLSIAYLLIRLATFEQSDGNYSDALTAGESALYILENNVDAEPYLIAYCLANIGHSYFWTFRHDQSTEYLTRALTLARKIGDNAIPAETLALAGLADLKMLWNEPEEGLSLSREAVARARVADQGSEICHFLDNLAYNCCRAERFLEAQRYYEEALEIAEARGSYHDKMKAHNALQGFFIARGDRYSYACIIERILERNEQLAGRTSVSLWSRKELVKLLLSIGDPDGAHHHCQLMLDGALPADVDEAMLRVIQDVITECSEVLNALGRHQEAAALTAKLAAASG